MSDPTLDTSLFRAKQVVSDAYAIARLWWWARNLLTLAVVCGTTGLFLAAAWSIAVWMLR